MSFLDAINIFHNFDKPKVVRKEESEQTDYGSIRVQKVVQRTLTDEDQHKMDKLTQKLLRLPT